MKQVLEFLNSGAIDYANTDWYRFLGFCDFHRISGYICDRLNKSALPPQVARHLKAQKNYQKMRGKVLYAAACELETALGKAGLSHAFLKGSALNGVLYSGGERDSNDVDLLIEPENVGRVGKILEELGYVQGIYKDGVIEKFSRKEIISRRMNRGETAPYVRLTEDDFVPFLEIDINFSLDWLPASNTRAVGAFLHHTEKCENGLTCLNRAYSLAFLCAHLYKEATILSMVKRYKDIEIYKYLDIFKLYPLTNVYEFERVIKEFGLEKECGYALYFTAQLFPKLGIRAPLPEEAYEVADPEAGGRKYVWEMDFFERLEDTNRVRFLFEPSKRSDRTDTLYRKVSGGAL